MLVIRLFRLLTIFAALALATGNAAFAAPAPANPHAPGAESSDEVAPPEDAKGGEEAKDEDEDEDDKKKKDKTLEKFVEEFEPIEGLFPLYRDPKKGELFMEIAAERIGQEFIYFTYTHNGLNAGGTFLGAIGGNSVVRIDKNYEHIEFVAENTSYYVDPASPLARVADANITPAVLAAPKIKATSEDGKRFLISADEIFLSEKLARIKPAPGNPHGKRFEIGNLSKEKTKYVSIRNYPKNTAIVSDFVYDGNKMNMSRGEEADYITDDRSIRITLQQTFIEMPEDGYDMRPDDFRIGYFTVRRTDLSDNSTTPYGDLIERWRLVKKDPSAEKSEPVTPITFWIENTTPLEFRDTIRDAALSWNLAFEEAGFLNAIEVKIQPDDAEWDAGDIRYNVIRWVSSPDPFFSGIGPNFVNPRTGEILGGDVVLEQVFVRNRLINQKTFSEAALTDLLPAEHGEEDAGPASASHCAVSRLIQMNTLFGLNALQLRGASAQETNEFIKEGLFYLALHEVGHTLGLSHNMRGSFFHSPTEIHDRKKTEKVGLISSVMDYPQVNIAPKGVRQGEYYTSRPGPYDVWAIKYGYEPPLEDADKEAERLANLAALSTKPEMGFGNDADDMRRSSRGIDPRVMVGDMSTDPVQYALDRMELVEDLLPGLLDKFSDDAESWQELRTAFLVATREQANAARVLSRYIGGIEVERARPGQKGASQPFTPVDGETQRRAMAILDKHVFGPDAFDLPEDLVAHLQLQRRGFDFFAGTEDPKVHDRVLRIQESVLAHLLHPTVLKRITDSGLYGNDYDQAEMLSDLTDAVVKADRRKKVSTFRRNLQIAYTERLIALLGIDDKKDPEVDGATRANVVKALNDVRQIMRKGAKGDASTRAHRAYLVSMIDQALNDAD